MTLPRGRSVIAHWGRECPVAAQNEDRGPVMDDKKPDRKDLEEFGIKILSGEVDEDSAGDLIQFILEEGLNKTHPHLTLILNSPGGCVASGMAIVDVMKGSKIPIHTVGIGMIASMGLSIFIAGEKGHRTLTPNTMILSHQFSGWTVGKEHELLATAKHHNLVGEMMVRHYRRCTGLSDKRVREELLPPTDVWLTAQQALALGICDEVKNI